MAHTSVLLQESIDGLSLSKGAVVLDATINGGGHSAEIARRHGSSVKIVGLDADKGALERADLALKEAGADFVLMNENFRHLDKALASAGLSEISAALFDLGLSSNQIDGEQAGRGFTFQKDEPLIMTFAADPKEDDLTAHVIANKWQEENIAQIIFSYGEDRYAKRIARAIVAARIAGPIETTSELAEIVSAAVPPWARRGRLHPATRTFQAFRLAVNDELNALKEGLAKSFSLLGKNGRLVVISFHSLEDRIVKYFFREKGALGEAVIITKKPIVPSQAEITQNRRSRSAKLRILQKN